MGILLNYRLLSVRLDLDVGFTVFRNGFHFSLHTYIHVRRYLATKIEHGKMVVSQNEQSYLIAPRGINTRGIILLDS